MKVKKTYVETEEVEVQETDKGKELSQLVHRFLENRENVGVDSLSFLVESHDTHDIFYTVQFNEDDGVTPTVRDVFLSANIIDYTDQRNLFIEAEEGHMDNFSFAHKLFKQLEEKPCFLTDNLMDKGFMDYYSNGFASSETTDFEARIALCKQSQ